jgi:hypothetical protein
MSEKHKDLLVRATCVTDNSRRLTIPNLGEELYMRVIREDGVIEFIPQITMKASSTVGEQNGE